MLDFLDREIKEKDCIVFIVNKRGKEPRLQAGTVKRINEKSIVAADKDSEEYRIVFSSRSFENCKLINTVLLNTHADRAGEIVDYVSTPIKAGDKAVFMEVPSQGFCTSFELGTVSRISGDGVTLLSGAREKHKCSRPPWKIIIV